MRADTIKSLPDLTLTFDPVALWPDPEACPDWPLVDATSIAHNTVGGERDAVTRLSALSRALNRGDHTHEPDTRESENIIKQNFADGGSGNWRWNALGFANKKPSSPTHGTADMIVESAHIRGFLRKMDSRQADNARRQKEEETRRHRHVLDRYKDQIKTTAHDLKQLAEAEARHNQRRQDEIAARKADELRQSLIHARFEASRAARALGETLPEPNSEPA